METERQTYAERLHIGEQLAMSTLHGVVPLLAVVVELSLGEDDPRVLPLHRLQVLRYDTTTEWHTCMTRVMQGVSMAYVI